MSSMVTEADGNIHLCITCRFYSPVLHPINPKLETDCMECLSWKIVNYKKWFDEKRDCRNWKFKITGLCTPMNNGNVQVQNPCLGNWLNCRTDDCPHNEHKVKHGKKAPARPDELKRGQKTIW